MAQKAAPLYMDPSGRGQRSVLVSWGGGLMNGSRIAAVSRFAVVTFSGELHCLRSRADVMLNITGQWQDSEILLFVLGVYYQK